MPRTKCSLTPTWRATSAGSCCWPQATSRPGRAARSAPAPIPPADAGRVGAAAVGVDGLQRLQLLRGRVAVADRLGPQASQARVGLAAGPQGVQPLAGDRGGGADLGRQLGWVEPLAAGRLAGQVGVGDLVAHQPHPQLRQRGQVGAGCSTRNRSPANAGATLTSPARGPGRPADRRRPHEPRRIGDPPPGRARVVWPLLLRLTAGGHAGRGQVEGHRRPSPALARPLPPPPPDPGRGPGGAGCA